MKEAVSGTDDYHSRAIETRGRELAVGNALEPPDSPCRSFPKAPPSLLEGIELAFLNGNLGDFPALVDFDGMAKLERLQRQRSHAPSCANSRGQRSEAQQILPVQRSQTLQGRKRFMSARNPSGDKGKHPGTEGKGLRYGLSPLDKAPVNTYQ